MFKWLKKLVIKFANSKAHKLVDSLDKYESELQKLIDEKTEPKEMAEVVINWVQERLQNVVKDVFGWFKKLLGGKLVKKIIADLSKEIENLDKYEDDLVKVIEKAENDAISLAPAVVDFVQEKLHELVDKIISID